MQQKQILCIHLPTKKMLWLVKHVYLKYFINTKKIEEGISQMLKRDKHVT